MTSPAPQPPANSVPPPAPGLAAPPARWARSARLVAFLKDDAGVSGAILLAGAGLLVVGSLLPWIRGYTRAIGPIDWNGLSDTGDGLILIVFAAITAAAVRWRRSLGELEPASRWIPLIVAIAAACIWLTVRWKVDYLTYAEIEVGARAQAGLVVVAIGVLFCVVGGWLFSRERVTRRGIRR
jgi:hypothetical protein